MDRLRKLLCLSLLSCLVPGLLRGQSIQVSGRYFIYCDHLKMIFGSGEIVLKSGEVTLQGSVLYYDVSTLKGVLYGGPEADLREPTPHHGDVVYFQGIPPRFHSESFRERVISHGDELQRFQLRKPTLEEFKDYALFFEFRGFSVDPRGRIRAETVIPYIMGMPSVPMRHFSVNRGSLENRSLFYLEDLHYTRSEGLALDSRLLLHTRPLRGDFSLKAYERRLFRLPGTPRGLLYSGRMSLYPGKTDLLSVRVGGDTGERSFNLALNRSQRKGWFEYELNQQFSGRHGAGLFTELSARVTLHASKQLRPRFDLRYNWKKSISYSIDIPLEVKEKVRFNLGMERRIFREGFHSDQMDLHANFGFQSHWFSMDSEFRWNRDMLDRINRKNFSIHLPFNPFFLLEKNISIAFTPYYLFNSFPTTGGVETSASPGIRILVQGRGLLLPFGFELRPNLAANHIWEGLEEDVTDFQSHLAIVRKLGGFELALEYNLSSRFLSREFWVEGTNTRNLSVSGGFSRADEIDLRLRLIMDNDLKPETLTWNGRVKLPWDLRLSSFMIFYVRGNRFQTLEVFVEKMFKHKLRIQGGYSLALKKFFIKLLLV